MIRSVMADNVLWLMSVSYISLIMVADVTEAHPKTVHAKDLLLKAVGKNRLTFLNYLGIVARMAVTRRTQFDRTVRGTKLFALFAVATVATQALRIVQ